MKNHDVWTNFNLPWTHETFCDKEQYGYSWLPPPPHISLNIKEKINTKCSQNCVTVLLAWN